MLLYSYHDELKCLTLFTPCDIICQEAPPKIVTALITDD